ISTGGFDLAGEAKGPTLATYIPAITTTITTIAASAPQSRPDEDFGGAVGAGGLGSLLPDIFRFLGFPSVAHGAGSIDGTRTSIGPGHASGAEKVPRPGCSRAAVGGLQRNVPGGGVSPVKSPTTTAEYGA